MHPEDEFDSGDDMGGRGMGRQRSYNGVGGQPKRSPLYKRLGEDVPLPPSSSNPTSWPGVIIGSTTPQDYGLDPLEEVVPGGSGSGMRRNGSGQSELGGAGGAGSFPGIGGGGVGEGRDIAPWLIDDSPEQSPAASQPPSRKPTISTSTILPSSRKPSLHNLSSHFTSSPTTPTNNHNHNPLLPPAQLSGNPKLPRMMSAASASGMGMSPIQGSPTFNNNSSSRAGSVINKTESSKGRLRGRTRGDSTDSLQPTSDSLPPLPNLPQGGLGRHGSTATTGSRGSSVGGIDGLGIGLSGTGEPVKGKRGFKAFSGLLKRKPTGGSLGHRDSDASLNDSPPPTKSSLTNRSVSGLSTTSNRPLIPHSGSITSLSGFPHSRSANSPERGSGYRPSLPLKDFGSAAKKGKKKADDNGVLPDILNQVFQLDTNLDHMEGIIDLSASANPPVMPFAVGGSGAGSGSSESGSDTRGRGEGGSISAQGGGSTADTSSVGWSGGPRRLTNEGDTSPVNPFARQNPFAGSGDSGSTPSVLIQPGTPPSPHSKSPKGALPNLSSNPSHMNQPRRPSALRNVKTGSSDMESDDNLQPIGPPPGAGSFQPGGTLFNTDPFGTKAKAAAVEGMRLNLGPTETGFPDYSVGGGPLTPDGGALSPGSIPLSGPSSALPMDSDAPPPTANATNAAWTAPESWGVEGDEVPEQSDTSDESEGEAAAGGAMVTEKDLNGTGAKMSGSRGMSKGESVPPPFGSSSGLMRGKGGRPGTGGRGVRPGSATRPGTSGSMQGGAHSSFIRIYAADGTYHTMTWPLYTTTHDIVSHLSNRSAGPKGAMKLYIRERGQDRQLQPSEKPLVIQMRRLLQAGYSEKEKLEELGRENLSMLCRFIYQTPVLPVIDPEDESSYDSFELVDLGNRDLQAVPIFLYRHAHSIISLNLSKNPMPDLPLDFVQACITLRELRMTHMAMKRLPSSIRQSAALTRLDISCNRIVDLEHVGLHEISTLVSIKVQNNRLTSLPANFAQLKNLKYLNISNNKFDTFPTVVCNIASLVDLDISFNAISTLPSEMGELSYLERLVAVGNSLSTFPESFSTLASLRELDVRRNILTDLNAVYALPNLAMFQADNNNLVVLDAELGPKVREFSVPHNSITRFTLAPLPASSMAYSLSILDLSYGKLSTLADDALGQLVNLDTLNLNYNQFVRLPETLVTLSNLRHLSCTDNVLASLPSGIGKLAKLEILNVHNNNLKELPESMWFCNSLQVLNASSNLLDSLPDVPSFFPEGTESTDNGTRKDSVASAPGTVAGERLPIGKSLRKLMLGDNQLTDDVFDPISLMTELKTLNLSFNDIYEIPTWTLSKNQNLEELYLSGNHLTSLPSEDLERLTNLRVIHLNGNKLQTLPAELGKIRKLLTLDVGSNVLKYNIANWPYDWNWNWNLELRYLNLSGNKRLEIKPSSQHEMSHAGSLRRDLSDFSKLSQLRVLGLMDVLLRIPSLPDESDERRVRTSFSDVNNMAYGISDTLGRLDQLAMFDLVVPNFRSKENECLFGMFGRAFPTSAGGKIPKYVQEWFTGTLNDELDRLGIDETVPDALRRTFLSLNKVCFESLAASDNRRKTSSASGMTSSSIAGPIPQNPHFNKSGAAGAVVYLVGKTLHVANAGDILAVVSCKGEAELLSVKHMPLDRNETSRIRAAEAWVSPKGLVNDEIDISRGFGFYNAVPAVNALPDVRTRVLSEADEFIIIGNRALWDYCSYQTAVDIARTEKDDPMMAAQKLRDFAISYGAEGSTMIMVISVGDLFHPRTNRMRQTAADKDAATADPDGFYSSAKRITRRRGDETAIGDRTLMRLQQEVEPPIGQVALVFTDIKNSTSLWETNPGMQTAMKMHNGLLRRQLRIIGGYEVKTEGDAFMVSFPTVTSAMLWSFICQLQLLNEDWPREILECDDGREVLDAQGLRIKRGLSVRMGIHWGTPVWEKDPITRRMDYFGPMVNKSSRISASADGGQIMASSDVLKEVQGLYDLLETDEQEAVNSLPGDVGRDVAQLRRLGLGVLDMGERKLKGLEVPEKLFLVYPKALSGRLEVSTQLRENVEVNSARLYGGGDSIVSLDEVRQLIAVCIRIEALSADKICIDRHHKHAHNGSPVTGGVKSVAMGNQVSKANRWLHHTQHLGPAISQEMSDDELSAIVESMTIRLENALSTLYLKTVGDLTGVLTSFAQITRTDPAALMKALAAFGGLLGGRGV